MSRYIKEEDIIKAIDESGQRYGITTANQCNFKEIVRKMPAADVAPKSEVAREIFAEIERTLDNYLYSNLLVGEIAPLSYYDAELEDAIAELKKKYTEGG